MGSRLLLKEIITFEEVRSSLDPLIPKIRLQSENEAEFKNLINQISRDLLQNKIDRIIIVKSAEKAGLPIPPLTSIRNTRPS